MSLVERGPIHFPWPPVLYVAAILASVALSWGVPLPWIGDPLAGMLFVAGILLAVVAVAMVMMSIHTMHKAKTSVRLDRPAAHLVQNGPYSISRNPIYLGNTLFMVGIGLAASMPWFISLSVVAAFLTQKLAIEHEERHLEQRFGKKYRDYCKRVRRWL
ncbi:isoprenylcysteine carboxylmethyltransferase family protein [bacterium]|nr:isoprenylcysteine carboxylmethyltransferase family protein [bacterium]